MKRFLAILCAVAMILQLCPVPHVHADITTPTDLVPCSICGENPTEWQAEVNNNQHRMVCPHGGEYPSVSEWHTFSAGGITFTPVGAEEHARYCWCGYAFGTEEHNWLGGYYLDADYCTSYCEDCSYVNVEQKHKHEYTCGNPGECAWCEATDCNMTEVHLNYNYTWDENGHTSVCSNCSTELEQNRHEVNCFAPNICCECGAQGTFVNPIVYHDTYVLSATETEHHWVCSECATEDESYFDFPEHRITCQEPGVCEACGYTGEMTNEIWHDTEWKKVDESTHVKYCVDCTTEFEVQNHWMYCDAHEPLCMECFSECGVLDIIHVGEDPENPGCCVACGESLNGGPQYPCDICGESAQNVEWGMLEDNVTHQEICEHGWVYSEHAAVWMECGTGINADHKWICSICGGNWGDAESEENPGYCENCGEEIIVYPCDICGEEPGDPYWTMADTIDQHVLYCEHGCAYDEMHAAVWYECGTDGIQVHTLICSVCDEFYGYPLLYTWKSGTECVESCELCGNEVSTMSHHVHCGESVCNQCGSTDIVEPVVDHSGDLIIEEDIHYFLCSECGVERHRGSHQLSCEDDGTICLYCGYEQVDRSKAQIEHASEILMNDDPEQHYYYCDECDGKFGFAPHEGNGVWLYDDMAHWQECGTCNALCGSGAHEPSAENPNVCICGMVLVPQYPCDICGEMPSEWMTEVEGNLHRVVCVHGIAYSERSESNWHEFEGGQYVFDEDFHYEYCIVCGWEAENGAEHTFGDYQHDDEWGCVRICTVCEQIQNQDHEAECDAPGVCKNCGWEDENIVTEHSWIKGKYIDKDYCATFCDECGYVDMDSLSGHQYACTAPGYCTYCKATDCNMTVFHFGAGTIGKDADGHYTICSGCEQESFREEHWASCETPGVCVNCGYEDADIPVEDHMSFVCVAINKKLHKYACVGCGEVLWTDTHNVECTDKTVCYDCGETGVEDPWVLHGHVEYEFTDKLHKEICQICGDVKWEEEHWAFCNRPGICDVCEYESEDIPVAGHPEYEYIRTDAGHIVQCVACKTALWEEEHCAACSMPANICEYCGYEGDLVEIYHYTEMVAIDENTHRESCYDCDYVGEPVKHTLNCDGSSDTICTSCGYTQVNPETARLVHLSDEEIGIIYNDTHHGYHCQRCDEDVFFEEHKPSDEDPTVCYFCDAELVSEPTATPTPDKSEEPTATPTPDKSEEPTATPTPDKSEEPTATPAPDATKKPETHQHTWVTTTVEATCTEDGETVVSCETCGEVKVAETVPATGHAYGAYADNNDGTHTLTCTTCGEAQKAACRVTTTVLGAMTMNICKLCGHATYTITLTAAADEVEADAEDTATTQVDTVIAAAATVKVVENVRIEATVPVASDDSVADEDKVATPVVPETAQLVVMEAVFEQASELPEVVAATPVKCFAVVLTDEGVEIQPSGTIRLSIPVEAEEAEMLLEKHLLLILEDGTIMEIPYEIIDGELVFETELVGVFMLVDEYIPDEQK